MVLNTLEREIAAFRSFNRFFTRKIGVLREGLLDSPFPLTEARIMYELGQGAPMSATELRARLDLDPGYLSRILGKFEESGLIRRSAAEGDARRRLVSLTEAGAAAFARLNERSRAEASRILAALPDADRERLVGAMAAIEEILGENEEKASSFVLRDPDPGDLGWVVERHGALYAKEYGWDASFEALVARIVADYAAGRDPTKERCWIADSGGRRAGCVFVVKVDDSTAKLRLLLVEPEARGRGLGKSLVEECVRFSRSRGYRKLVLWTNSVLAEARGIYAAEGFVLVASEPKRNFGKDLVSETWELQLS